MFEVEGTAGCGYFRRVLAGDEIEQLKSRLQSGATPHRITIVMLGALWAGRSQQHRTETAGMRLVPACTSGDMELPRLAFS
jgi:hypothetical protein